MRTLFCCLLAVSAGCVAQAQKKYIPLLRSYPATDKHILYMGRVERSDSGTVRFWSPGVVVRMKASGRCVIFLRDEVPNENTHNYIGLTVGDQHYRVKLKERYDTLLVLEDGGVILDRRVIALGSDADPEVLHDITLCKDTESGIGWLEVTGVKTEALRHAPRLPGRKIECIGNSITAGTGMDLSEIPCGTGQWYDQHNAWMSYGAQTARSLDAQWHLTAVAGIGLVHSCCDMGILMPQVFGKMDLRDNSGSWDFHRYVPDVVTVCLGQNDGIQDSALFCGAYVRFLGEIRRRYHRAQIVCLTSPMGNKALTDVQKRYLTGVVAAMRAGGDGRVSSYFFSRQFSHGCGGHPDLEEHGSIAAELTAYLKELMGW